MNRFIDRFRSFLKPTKLNLALLALGIVGVLGLNTFGARSPFGNVGVGSSSSNFGTSELYDMEEGDLRQSIVELIDLKDTCGLELRRQLTGQALHTFVDPYNYTVSLDPANNLYTLTGRAELYGTTQAYNEGYLTGRMGFVCMMTRGTHTARVTITGSENLGERVPGSRALHLPAQNSGRRSTGRH